MCILIFTDLILFAVSYAGSYLLRFDFNIPSMNYLKFQSTLIYILLLKIFIFYYYGLYRSIVRYTSIKDLVNIVKASLISTSSIVLLIFIIYRFEGFPRSVFLIDCALTILFIGGIRLVIRVIFQSKGQAIFSYKKNKNNRQKRKKLLIIGAGDAGEKILREIKDNAGLTYQVMGFLDDNPEKLHRDIHGVKVLDYIDKLAPLVNKLNINEIIIAIPSAGGKKMRRIIDLCRKAEVKFKTLPSLGELINAKVSISNIRDVSYLDLLGRNQVELEIDKIGAYLKDKCVLITGAGGSIGSEFCRQVVKFKPKILVMLDRAESSLYDIEMELKYYFPNQKIIPVLCSVTCLPRLKKIFNQFKPQVVFHAAAYKHVPMMESFPWEAIYNNVFGTKNTLEVSLDAGVERFILISTDKAVRPHNIMGASKRMAEIILHLKYKEIMEQKDRGIPTQTKIMAVRFGNVIGSAGSVIPLFKKQIALGGPVTITDPKVTRYFMTINEAVQLVLQAGAMGENGAIYILKMGQPIKITDMAEDLIRLSGFKPHKDIRIKFTGLRPGEKLCEELFTEDEGIVPTSHDKLMVLKSYNSNSNFCYSYLERKIEELIVLADLNDKVGIKMKLQEILTEYNTQKMVFTSSKILPKSIPATARPVIGIDLEIQ